MSADDAGEGVKPSPAFSFHRSFHSGLRRGG